MDNPRLTRKKQLLVAYLVSSGPETSVPEFWSALSGREIAKHITEVTGESISHGMVSNNLKVYIDAKGHLTDQARREFAAYLHSVYSRFDAFFRTSNRDIVEPDTSFGKIFCKAYGPLLRPIIEYHGYPWTRGDVIDRTVVQTPGPTDFAMKVIWWTILLVLDKLTVERIALINEDLGHYDTDMWQIRRELERESRFLSGLSANLRTLADPRVKNRGSNLEQTPSATTESIQD